MTSWRLVLHVARGGTVAAVATKMNLCGLICNRSCAVIAAHTPLTCLAAAINTLPFVASRTGHDRGAGSFAAACRCGIHAFFLFNFTALRRCSTARETRSGSRGKPRTTLGRAEIAAPGTSWRSAPPSEPSTAVCARSVENGHPVRHC